MSQINLIPPRVGFVRFDQNGEYVLSREGFLFLRDMFNRIGGTDSSSNADLDVAQQFDGGRNQEDAKNFYDALNNLAVPDTQYADISEINKRIDSMLVSINALSSANYELAKEIESLKITIT